MTRAPLSAGGGGGGFWFWLFGVRAGGGGCCVGGGGAGCFALWYIFGPFGLGCNGHAQSLSQDRGVWRVLTTESDAGHATQGQGPWASKCYPPSVVRSRLRSGKGGECNHVRLHRIARRACHTTAFIGPSLALLFAPLVIVLTAMPF